MRVLVVGAGAIGGYFGGRLLAAGRDVTFLVRPRRGAQLAETGLAIRSANGDLDLAPPLVQAGSLNTPFDLILLSCKAFDLSNAIESFAAAVGPATIILPLLNGMAHLEQLEARFGPRAVLGGQCAISVTVDDTGRIQHLGNQQSLSFGERGGSVGARIDAVTACLSDTNTGARLSRTILLEMWEKWVFIAAAAALTCLMRTSVGDIVAAGGTDLANRLVDECAGIAARAGMAPRLESLQRARALLTTPDSHFTASMLRDVERKARTEVDHILGDLLHRGGTPASDSLLRIAYTHLHAYEARRSREEEGQPLSGIARGAAGV